MGSAFLLRKINRLYNRDRKKSRINYIFKEESIMTKKIIVLVMFITIIMTGCGKAPTATLEPEETENIITEKVIEEEYR